MIYFLKLLCVIIVAGMVHALVGTPIYSTFVIGMLFSVLYTYSVGMGPSDDSTVYYILMIALEALDTTLMLVGLGLLMGMSLVQMNMMKR